MKKQLSQSLTIAMLFLVTGLIVASIAINRHIFSLMDRRVDAVTKRIDTADRRINLLQAQVEALSSSCGGQTSTIGLTFDRSRH